MIKSFVFSFFDLLFSIIRKFFKTPTGNFGNKLVVVSFNKIGDSVLTVPAIRQLINNNPEEEVIIFTFQHTAPIYKKLLPEVTLIEVPSNKFALNRWISSEYRKILKAQNPRKIYDLTGNILSVSLIFNSKASSLYGLYTPYSRSLYDFSFEHEGYLKLTHKYLQLVYDNYEEWDKLAELPLNNSRDNHVLINPFGGWDAKLWGYENFIQLTKLLLKDYKVTLTFQKGMVNSKELDRLNKDNIEFIETFTLNEVLSFYDGKGAYIGNDSGPLHMAAMLGVPTFGVYGPTNPVSSKPEGYSHMVIQKSIHCSPKPEDKWCYTNAGRKGCDSFECMNQLCVEEVYNAIKIFLETNNVKKSNID